MNSEINYCRQLVQQHDPDRYLLSMFVPAERREALWALFAFNHEIAKTREVVSETQLGLIRLQWWRERVGEIYDGKGPVEHEVLKPLAVAIKEHDLPQEWFDALIYAREFDLEDVCPAHLEGLLIYVDHTSVPLMKLAVQIVGGDVEQEPVQQVAMNYALAGILRSAAHLAAHRRCLLPQDLLLKHGQTLNQLYDGKPADELPEVVRAVAEQAVSGLRPENVFLRKLDRLAWIYLKQLRNVGYDVFDARLGRAPFFKELRLIF